MFAGIDDRLTKEMIALAPASIKVKIVASSDRKCIEDNQHPNAWKELVLLGDVSAIHA